MLVNAADKWATLAGKQGDQAPPVRFELADAQRLTGCSADSQQTGAGSASSASSTSASTSSAAETSSSGSREAGEAPGTPRQGVEAAPASGPHRPQLREPRTFPAASFDVVVDTFGLCSQQDPVTALKVGGWGVDESRGRALVKCRTGRCWLCRGAVCCSCAAKRLTARRPPPPRTPRRRWHVCVGPAAASCCCSTARAAGALSTAF